MVMLLPLPQCSPVQAVSSAVTLFPRVDTLAPATLELCVSALARAVPLVLSPWAVTDRVAELAGGDTHPGPGAAQLTGGAHPDEGQAGAGDGAVQLVCPISAVPRPVTPPAPVNALSPLTPPLRSRTQI